MNLLKASTIGVLAFGSAYGALLKTGAYTLIGQVTTPSIAAPTEWTVTGLFAMTLYFLMGKMNSSIEKLSASQDAHTAAVRDLKDSVDRLSPPQ